MNDSEKEADNFIKSLDKKCILDLAFEYPLLIVAILFPEINNISSPGFLDNINQNSFSDVPYTPHGLLGLLKIEHGEFLRETIRLTFSQGIRIFYECDGKKHGDIITLIFLTILDQCPSVQLAVLKDIERINSDNGKRVAMTELYTKYLKVLNVQSEKFRSGCFHRENISKYISNHISLLRIIWSTKNLRDCERYSNSENNTIKIGENEMFDFEYDDDESIEDFSNDI